MDITGYALVTGGASGIGSACCKALAKAGARGILIADINLPAAERMATELKTAATNPEFQALAVHLDVTVEESVKSTVAYISQSFGRVDYCIHCAAIPAGSPGEVSSASFEDFKRLLEVNVQGTFLITSHVLAQMRSQEPKQVHPGSPKRGTARGTLVNMASLMSYIPLPNMVQYVTSKHAVMGISKTAALENVTHGIRVNCVCPSYTDTPMMQKALDVTPGLEESIVSGIPMGRLATAEEVADTVMFLCSPMSSYITGCGLIVDGGMSLSTKT
ncbi:NAD(P)-binding protein [Hypomontagnella submonticulosa]|nr:NAD(P)-binding protein [Hypomontagnella submonticulosa]